jgi:nucleotide-binding universal stress UspA family protein
MYDDVLVPTDGSAGAERGVEHALSLAETHDATLHVLSVVDTGRYGETPALSDLELVFEAAEREAAERAEAVADRAAERGLDAAPAVSRGRPAEEITEYAEDHADIVVMGVHGTTDGIEPHAGRVTRRVLRTCDVPVITV